MISAEIVPKTKHLCTVEIWIWKKEHLAAKILNPIWTKIILPLLIKKNRMLTELRIYAKVKILCMRNLWRHLLGFPKIFVQWIWNICLIFKLFVQYSKYLLAWEIFRDLLGFPTARPVEWCCYYSSWGTGSVYIVSIF